MSGHSKWSTIKRDKEVKDKKRGKLFSKVSKAITIAAREGGGDINMNPALRLAVEKAKEARMPKENIERAIKKGTGEGKGSGNIEEVIYEGFGPSGEAFFIKAFTDNRNRTVAEIRSIFSQFGGSLGAAGSTSYIFTPDPNQPTFKVEVDDNKKAKIKSLYEELEEHDDVHNVYANLDL